MGTLSRTSPVSWCGITSLARTYRSGPRIHLRHLSNRRWHIPASRRNVKVTCMTVCETDPVHEDYGLICEHFDRIAVPSEFCRDVLSRQFPQTEFYVIHAHPQRPYAFYHIGNIADDRKQFNSILEAFVRLNKPDARLLVKATCNRPVEIKLRTSR